jgi:hypothetical protein
MERYNQFHPNDVFGGSDGLVASFPSLWGYQNQHENFLYFVEASPNPIYNGIYRWSADSLLGCSFIQFANTHMLVML